MRVGAVKIYTTSSNSTIKLSYSNPLVLYNIKILAINPIMDLTITVTNANGDKWSFTVQSGTEINFKKVNYQSITFNDSYNYIIYYTLQTIYANCYQELLELEKESDISINSINYIPKGSIIFTSSQNWVVPVGVYKIKILAIGAGGGGGGGYSTTYVGGGGGAGAIVFVETIVQPGDTLSITIGAGGSAGTGGATPTAGGNGGNTVILNQTTGFVLVNAGGGSGGGAASSSANGSGGAGGLIGQPNFSVLASQGANGNPGSGQNAGYTPIFSANFSGVSSVTISSGGPPPYVIGAGGGGGGGVNANGGAGGQGIVIIWWGD